MTLINRVSNYLIRWMVQRYDFSLQREVRDIYRGSTIFSQTALNAVSNRIKGTTCTILVFKYQKTTTVLYILLTCVLGLSKMFPRMFKSREISHFNRVLASPANNVI